MEPERRLAVLTRHLAAATVSSSGSTLQQFDPREVYLFLTRDNLELRSKILDFLQVGHWSRQLRGVSSPKDVSAGPQF